MSDRIQIGGIKLSEELVQIDFLEPGPISPKVVALLQRISSEKISISHFHQNASSKAIQTTLCIAADHVDTLQRIIEKDFHQEEVHFQSPIGTITLFPHRSDLGFVVKILEVLEKKNLPICGMSTSVSALVLHADYTLLERAVSAILTVCRLPENHTPFRPKIVLGDEVVETIAVYWEDKIRIYGISTLPQCVLFQISCKLENDNQLVEVIESLAPEVDTFSLLICQKRLNSGGMQMNLLVEKKKSTKVASLLDALLLRKPHDFHFSLEKDVELISFYGPHFQDRYGIAGTAYSLLLENEVVLPASSCSGTSVQLIVHEKMSRSAVSSLGRSFVIPKSGRG